MSENFFVTGGTGLVGTFLLPRILRFFPGSRVTLLIRGNDDVAIAGRIASLCRRLEERDGILDARERVRGLRGDVLHERCGLAPKTWESLSHETSYIIHGAATIRFDHPLDEARRVNWGGTRIVLGLAEECVKRGNLKRFVYLGTSSVSGRRGGRILETELEMGQSFFNTYEESKCESERLVRSFFNRIPAVVFRPSIIIGDSRSGETTSFNVIYIPLRLVHRGLLSMVPGTPDTLMDLVPIDWVDDVMVHIMTKDEANGKVCHVTAGPERAAPLGEVVLRAISYFDKHAPLGAPRKMEFVSREEFNRRRSLTRGRSEAIFAQLDTLLPYVSVNRLFDSRTTEALLEGSGIEFPRFNTYAENIFSYCLATRWGKEGGSFD
jgi:thioester reductase-like protein